MIAGFECDENMRIMVEINRIKLICLLDTGAHNTLIGCRESGFYFFKNIL